MSEWIERKVEDMSIDGDDLNIFVEQDSFGRRWVSVKIEDIKKILKNGKRNTKN